MRSSAASFHARYGNSLRQFGKIWMVGGMGVLVNMAVAFVLNKLHGGTRYAQQVIWSIPGTPYNIRFTVLVWIGAFLVANLVNFLLNRHWTFKGARAPFWREFWPFFAVGSLAAFAGVFIKIGFTNPTSPLFLPEPYWHEETGLRSREYWSQLLTIVITMPINFVANKLWTFRAVRRRHAGSVAP